MGHAERHVGRSSRSPRAPVRSGAPEPSRPYHHVVMILPVEVDGGDLDCCQPEAEVGQRWSVPVLFVPEADGDGRFETPLTPSQEEQERVVLDLSRVRGFEDDEFEIGLFESMGLRFRGPRDLDDGVHAGRLRVDAHRADGAAIPAVLSGVVARISLLPILYRRTDRQGYLPSRMLEAIPAQSSRDRIPLRERPGGLTTRLYRVLVALQVQTKP